MKNNDVGSVIKNDIKTYSFIDIIKEHPNEWLKSRNNMKRFFLKEEELCSEEKVTALITAYDLGIIEFLQSSFNEIQYAETINNIEKRNVSGSLAEWSVSTWRQILYSLGFDIVIKEDHNTIKNETINSNDESIELSVPYEQVSFIQSEIKNYINLSIPNKKDCIYISCGIGNTDHGFYIHGIKKVNLCKNKFAYIFAVVLRNCTHSLRSFYCGVELNSKGDQRCKL